MANNTAVTNDGMSSITAKLQDTSLEANKIAPPTAIAAATATVTVTPAAINNVSAVSVIKMNPKNNEIIVNNNNQEIQSSQTANDDTTNIIINTNNINNINKPNENQNHKMNINLPPKKIKKDDDIKDAEDDNTNLIINYLPPTMSEGTLATLFSPYGSLERCKIVVDLQTLRSRGYGFVKYDNAVSAERALNALNGYELNGKKLKVAFARSQCKAITNANLYITNIPLHYKDTQLKVLFAEFGRIVECRILKDQSGKSRGVGFVRMDTHIHAIQALQQRDNYVVEDGNPPLLVKLAQRRVPRRFWNSQNRNNNNNNNNNNKGNAMNGSMSQGGGMANSNNMMGNQMNNSVNNRRKNNSMNQNRRSPRRYYQKSGQQTFAGSGGGMQTNNLENQNMQQSPNRRGGGYYRPRQQPYTQNKPQYKPRRANSNQGPQQQYFPAAAAPMYETPYIQQYNNPAYTQMAPPLTTAAAMSNAPPNHPSGVGQSLESGTSVVNNEQHPPHISDMHHPMYSNAPPPNQTQNHGNTAVVGNANAKGDANSNANNNRSNNSNNAKASNKPKTHNASTATFNVLVFNLPSHFNVDHIINMYAKYGPVQSVNIRDHLSDYPNHKGPVGIISYFYFDDAQRAQNETNGQRIGNDDRRLETMFQPPVK